MPVYTAACRAASLLLTPAKAPQVSAEVCAAHTGTEEQLKAIVSTSQPG